METQLLETLRERQAQGIALHVACFHEVVRQSSGQRAAQYKCPMPYAQFTQPSCP
ncbi:MAG: hypothetical protein ACYTX0_46595 [Nostoc sp.]